MSDVNDPTGDTVPSPKTPPPPPPLPGEPPRPEMSMAPFVVGGGFIVVLAIVTSMAGDVEGALPGLGALISRLALGLVGLAVVGLVIYAMIALTRRRPGPASPSVDSDSHGGGQP